MSDTVDYLIIGAGIIGLAIARTLAPLGRVIILEADQQIGNATSFRNSAVLHAGIYYPYGSLKAQLCQEGQNLLYSYCQARGVQYKTLGKLIVATQESQVGELEALVKNAQQNGIQGLHLLTSSEVRSIEPNIHCAAALHSSITGIIDGKGLLQAYLREAESYGAKVLLSTAFTKGYVAPDGIRVQVSDRTLTCRYLINAAGLSATKVAYCIEGLPLSTIPPQYYAKGSYFLHKGQAPFSRLVYPLPEAAGLGIHATCTLAGETLFGPDVEWIDEIHYPVDINRRPLFYTAIKRYYPGISPEMLEPAFSGIRTKIVAPEKQPQDFIIQTWRDHGIPGLINLYGIESPGLTASLAIGHYISRLINV